MRVATLFLLSSLAAVAACSSSQNPPPEGAPGTGMGRDGRPVRPRIDSTRSNRVIENSRPDAPARAGLLLVANQQAGSASVVDAATMKSIATIPVGTGPHEAAVSPDGRWGVVTIYGDRAAAGNKIAVIDLTAAVPTLTRTIDLGQYTRPHGAAFIQDGRKLLVTSEATQKLLIVDFASGRVDTALATNAKGSHMVAVRRDGKRAWTANIGDGNVTEYDIEARRTVRQLPAAAQDEGIATTPGGILLWVGSNSEKTVTIIDTEKGQTIATLSGFGAPYRIGISRTGRIAVVCDPTNNKLWFYEVGGAVNRSLATVDLSKEKDIVPIPGNDPTITGAGPEGVTFDPIADIAYITLNGSNQVVAVDLVTFKVLGVATVGAAPDGIAFSQVVRRP